MEIYVKIYVLLVFASFSFWLLPSSFDYYGRLYYFWRKVSEISYIILIALISFGFIGYILFGI